MNIASIAVSLSKDPSASIPLFDSKVQAGFPSPADDHMNSRLDLSTHLVPHPLSTFFVRVTGDSMIDAGIKDNDLLVVDKSLEATNGKIVIAVVEGEFTVKRLKLNAEGDSYLMPANENFSPIRLCPGSYIWGVVTKVISDV